MLLFHLLSYDFLKTAIMAMFGTSGGCYVFGCPAFFSIPDTFLRSLTQNLSTRNSLVPSASWGRGCIGKRFTLQK